MPKITNLASEIKNQLPAELLSFMQVAGQVAQHQEESLYLVGGVVRDLLLGQTNLDLDLVVEGNATNLARQLVPIIQAKIRLHPHFNTAKLQWDKWSVDLATARSETYARPGALPSVKPSSLSNDLARRDFTINTMAIHLNPSHYGELTDLHGGRDDLEHKLIRVLHEQSFIDDATRIWRGLRYEQRLDFRLERKTLELLNRDISMLDTISGDRIRHELELILKEKYPEKVLRRAKELGVLPALHPTLKGNGWLAEKFEQARQLSSPNPPSTNLYLALLAYRLAGEESEDLISRLKLPKPAATTLRDTLSLQTKLPALASRAISQSAIYRLLHGYSPSAITANSLASNSAVARQHMQLFLNKLRYVKSALNGDDLIKMGIASGPQIKEVLQLLHEARLDGKVRTKKDEEELVKGWLAKN